MKHIFFIFIFIAATNSIIGQSIRIVQEGLDPLEIESDPSVLLDLVSYDKGLLIPRLTSEERQNIESPALGLLVFDVERTAFCFYDGQNWVDLYGLQAQDCGGEIPFLVWPDMDGDGYGCKSAIAEKWCIIPPGYSPNNGDCDDNDVSINPAATDDCNFLDDDCDGFVDEDGLPQLAWRDADGDGYGDMNSTPNKVCGIPFGYVSNNDDCNDTDANINPPAKDNCNFIDDDCDGFVDEDVLPKLAWIDADGDGYGDMNSTPNKVCGIPFGYVSNNDDCNDTDPNINPPAKDNCNFIDDDCDGFVDEDGLPQLAWIDADGDGYGI